MTNDSGKLQMKKHIKIMGVFPHISICIVHDDFVSVFYAIHLNIFPPEYPSFIQ